MKDKALIIVNIIFLSLIIIVLISFMIFGMMGKFPTFSSNTKLVYENSYSLSDIKEIKMNFKSYDIEIVEGSSDSIKLEVYSNKKQDDIVSNLVSNTLELNQKGSTFCFGFCYRNQRVVLTIPKENTILYSLSSTSGDIDSKVDFGREDNYIHTTSGNIHLKNVLSGEIRSTSGDISTHDGKSLNVHSTSGEIQVHSLEKGSISTTSGDITIQNMDEVDVSSTSGEISIDSFIGNGKISTTSGDIKILSLEILGDTKVSSTSGDVRIGLKNGANISTHTISGEKDIKSSSGEYELAIETVSGDILVK